MIALSTDTLRELLAESLKAWHLPGDVRSTGRAISLSCNGAEIEVETAPPGSQFRWMVTVNGRKRPALALPAVLRRLRAVLDPQHEYYRARIAPEPVVPP